MTQYPYIEDYLELLAGIDPTSPHKLVYPVMPVGKISLARYDVKVIESMSAHTMFGGALTDKQAELAVNLVLKYRRQFAKNGVDVTPAENPQFRVPLRSIDRSKTIWYTGDKLALKFPYNEKLIEQVREYKKTSQGKVDFVSDDKTWYFGITEPNVNWLATWGQVNGFELDLTVKDMLGKIIECEGKPYAIELIYTPEGFKITNATESLIEYVNLHVGGFGLDNWANLVDYAGVLGYTIEQDLLANLPDELTLFKQKRKIHLPPHRGDNHIAEVLDYADKLQRYPVCIFDPQGRYVDSIDFTRYPEDEVVKFNHSGKTSNCNYNIHNVKVVYANKIPATWDYRVPLLITTVDMMYGGRRMDWISRAEKIVYYCSTKLKEED